jgi:protein phosphatase
MNLLINAVCDIGSVRSNNEDAVLVGDEILQDATLLRFVEITGKSDPWCAAVADGMGGANAGEVASIMVLEHFRSRLKHLEKGLDDEALKQIITTFCNEIHRAVLIEGMNDLSKRGMGTTLTALLNYGGEFWYVHAGDSRLYRLRDGILTRLSRDHSLREFSGSSEVPSNIIINSFGGGNTFFLDIDRAGRKVFAGDVYLLCSDGLTDMLSDEEIEHIMADEDFENKLLTRSKSKGGGDNISYIVVELI